MDKYFQNAKFIKSAYSLKDCPDDGRAEIVLAGRSNVGKSSLINSLCYQKNLAKVASTPGKTQAVIYFDIKDHFYLTDLPGYGFSKSGQLNQEKFSKLADSYFSADRNIKCVLLLMDAKVGPSAQDVQMLEFLEDRGFTYAIVMNKLDKLNRSEKDKCLAELKRILKELNIDNREIFWISNTKKTDIDKVREYLKSLVKS